VNVNSLGLPIRRVAGSFRYLPLPSGLVSHDLAAEQSSTDGFAAGPALMGTFKRKTTCRPKCSCDRPVQHRGSKSALFFVHRVHDHLWDAVSLVA